MNFYCGNVQLMKRKQRIPQGVTGVPRVLKVPKGVLIFNLVGWFYLSRKFACELVKFYLCFILYLKLINCRSLFFDVMGPCLTKLQNEKKEVGR